MFTTIVARNATPFHLWKIKRVHRNKRTFFVSLNMDVNRVAFIGESWPIDVLTKYPRDQFTISLNRACFEIMGKFGKNATRRGKRRGKKLVRWNEDGTIREPRHVIIRA